MRTLKYLPLMAVALVASWGGLRLSLLTSTPSFARTVAATPNVAVGPQYDTAHVYQTVNGVAGRGGALDAGGPVIAGGMVFVGSGYGQWGGMPGNVLLAYSIDGK